VQGRRRIARRGNRPPAALRPYLDELSRRLRAVVGARLVGVYAGGSVALGGYESGRSDVDVAAVADGPVTTGEKEALVARLRHEALPCPARGLELVLYGLEAARSGTAAPGFELNLNTGARMQHRVDLAPVDGETHWFAIDRSILAEHGVAIVGPPADVVFAPVPRAALLPLVAESLAWHEQGDGRGDDAVLNACRALRYAREGVWSSKPEAGRWALAALPEGDLVCRALDARAGGAAVEPAAAGAFVARVREAVLAAAG
jgi:Domain of unknown function (DUF4111)